MTTHAELRALGMAELARRENYAMQQRKDPLHIATSDGIAHAKAVATRRDNHNAMQRAKAVEALSNGPATIKELASAMSLTSECVRTHLRALEADGKVTNTKGALGVLIWRLV